MHRRQGKVAERGRCVELSTLVPVVHGVAGTITGDKDVPGLVGRSTGGEPSLGQGADKNGQTLICHPSGVMQHGAEHGDSPEKDGSFVVSRGQHGRMRCSRHNGSVYHALAECELVNAMVGKTTSKGGGGGVAVIVVIVMQL